MLKIYACLVGKWVNLTDEPTATIGNDRKLPNIWYEENADIWNPNLVEQEHTYYQLPYVRVDYQGTSYRINPIFIQVVQ